MLDTNEIDDFFQEIFIGSVTVNNIARSISSD